MTKMTGIERRSTAALSSIMCLRMLGLFMIMPVFTLYAEKLTGATPSLIGLAIGIYGLTQGLLQIPFGFASDCFGRKKVIFFGLVLFAIGSIWAALAQTIEGVIIGRALQGAGAVGSTVMALLADLTRDNQRTKAMAGIGMTIGASFSLAMILGPLLNTWIRVPGIFWLTTGLALLGIFILIKIVPTPLKEETSSEKGFLHLLKNTALMRLNIGIFIQHAILTANFVVLPLVLTQLSGLHGNHQWALYLPILIGAFIISVPCMLIAERKQHVKTFFLAAIICLGFSEFLLWFFAKNLLISAVSLLLFFSAFSLLEAFLPSLVSRTAPSSRKGTALGIYSSAQFLGIFFGGAAGGWLYGKFGLVDVYLFGVGLALLWLLATFQMKIPHYR